MANNGNKMNAELLSSRILAKHQLYFDGAKPYLKVSDCRYQRLSDEEAIAYITDQLTDDEKLATPSTTVAESLKRLSSLSNLQLRLAAHFEEQKYLLNLMNGVFDIRKGIPVGNMNDLVFDYQLDFRYIRGKTLDHAPNFRHYCETSVGKQNLPCFLRILGYILSSLTDAKKAFFLVGDGNTGKSMFMDLLERVIGPDVVSSEPFESIGNEQARANFCAKRLNISREAKRAVLRNESAFKSLVACEKIKGRRLYENGITFTPHLKLLTASNQMVAFRETDDAILDRIVVLFMHSTLQHDQLDRELFAKLYAERDVIFSLAVDTLPDLIKTGYDFQMPAESANFLAACRTQFHTVELFLIDRCEIRKDAEIPTTTLLDAYQKYCRRNGFEPVGRNSFYEQIQWHGGSGITREKVYDLDRTRVQGFKGIRLKTITADNEQAEEKTADKSSDSSLLMLARPPPLCTDKGMETQMMETAGSDGIDIIEIFVCYSYGKIPTCHTF